LENRSESVAAVLEVGSRRPDDVSEYPDIDLRWGPGGKTHKDGKAY
jgi:uncharacterized cupin superfamily protein